MPDKKMWKGKGVMKDRNDTIITGKFKYVGSRHCHGVLRQKSYE